MNSKEYATLAVNIAQSWGKDLPVKDALHLASKLIYHQRRLSVVKGEKEIEKILIKCKELTGSTWDEENGKLIGAFEVPA